MSSSSFEPQDAADPPQPITAESPSPSNRSYDRSLLENVLRQTLAESEVDFPFEDEEREALLGVVQLYSGQPFSLEPIAVGLVQAVLRVHFRRLTDSPDFWRPVSVQIAQTLVEDPVAGPRLQRLWDRLIQMKP
jgi:hypothetical protein